MCGIFGEFSTTSNLLDQAAFMKINALSYNRGPDSSGHYSNNKSVQLGFNRLAILDLTTNGDQPMHSPSGRYTIVFNGEIYNHLDLRKKMADHQVIFKGHSDTETIVNGLDIWGLVPTIELLDGMFGMAIFDHEIQSIHLVRDFAGIKPIHFGIHNHRLVFASQYNQVSQHPEFVNQEIDPAVLKLYLRQHYVPAPLGILKNTYQVLPGEIVTVNKDFLVSKHRYWEMPSHVEPTIFDEKKALIYLEEHLEAAVKDELLSDVPLGSFLSGGIDSPLVCFYAQRNFSQQLKAFTIGSDSKVHDESDDATTYANSMHIDLLLNKMDSHAAMAELDHAMSSLTEPFADPSIIPTYLVSKLARQQVTVALSGDGGDELFFGYERFWSVLKNRKFQHWPSGLKYLIYGADKAIFGKKYLNSNLLYDHFGQGHFQGHSRMSNQMVEEVFPTLKGVALPDEFNVYDYPDFKSELEILGAMRKAEFYGMMQKTLLKVDRASMANSLEVRVPFLKKSFIEASFALDPKLSFGPDIKKELLKKLLRSKVPEAPIDNRKRGFSIPLQDWIRQGLKEKFEDVLFDNQGLQKDFDVNSKALNTIFQNHISGKRDLKWPLFTVYSLYHWSKCLGK